MEKVKTAVIGIGNMGTAHAQSLWDNRVPGLALAAVCDTDPARLAYAAKAWPGVASYAGILISCLGAVMDVSVSITAALEEIRAKAPTLSLRELVRSGLTVGHDMIGTMSNTLILAYTGTATGTLLTLYAYEMPYIQMMSYNAMMTRSSFVPGCTLPSSMAKLPSKKILCAAGTAALPSVNNHCVKRR